MRFKSCFALFLVSLGGCMMSGGAMDVPPGPTVIPQEPGAELPNEIPAVDENPAPEVVEVSLSAAPASHDYIAGRPALAWAFNGSIPGPLIEAHRGDQVIIHFSNDLPEATSIHWHGVRAPNDMDGAGRLRQPIPAGGKFDYRFVVPDAGLFWYHPHVRSDVQVDMGLYGAIIVRDRAEPDLAVASERVLVLDDILVDPTTGQPLTGLDRRSMMMGREGNLLLVNGEPSNRAITVLPGQRTRLRIVNVANARFFNLRFDGGTMIQVGSDGGLLPAPRAVDTLLLVPGERVDVVVETSGMATLRTVAYERAMGAGGGQEVDLVRFVPSGTPVATPPALPSILRSVQVLAPNTGPQTSRLGEHMAHHNWQFTINDQLYPNVPLVSATLGTSLLWVVKNESHMDHPFHLHGFFFQRRGIPAWEDTINIPAQETVELVVDVAPRDGAAGVWLYHCHILEHAEAGMMGEASFQ